MVLPAKEIYSNIHTRPWLLDPGCDMRLPKLYSRTYRYPKSPPNSLGVLHDLAEIKFKISTRDY